MNQRAHTFGNALARWRQKEGLSQEALAAAAGIHRTYVSQLERGLKSPTVTLLFKIADALGTSPSAILREVEKDLDELQGS